MVTTTKNNKALNISLWIAQGILAVLFLMAGILKSTQPIEQLAASLPWVKEVPPGLVRFIGISELLGAIGLVLPALLRVKPRLTFWASAGIATIMLFALVFHIATGEFSVIGMVVVIGLVATFVAWGRAKKVPIQPKAQNL